MEIQKYISESKKSDWKGCLMLSMSGEVSRMVAAWSKNNIPDDCLAKDGREDYCHCTLLYGFPQHTEFEDVERASMIGYTPESMLSITLGKIKRFHANSNRPESDVLVIEIKPNEQLNALHHDLKQQFNVKLDYPNYNPHITIAYVKPGALAELDGSTIFDDFEAYSRTMTYSTGPSDGRSRRVITFDTFASENGR